MLLLSHSSILLLVICTLSRLVDGFQCYASLPSSFTLDDTYEYQSSGHCHEECVGKGYKYFALKQRNQCYCGNDNPASSESTSDSCDGACYGYSSEMCGGSNAYSVYSIPENGGTSVEVAASGSSGSSASSSSTSSESSSSSASSSSSSSTTSSSTTTTSSSSSSSTTSSPSTTPTAQSSSSQTSRDSVIYLTTMHSEGGSTVYVTSTITTSTQGMPTGNTTVSSDNSKGAKKKKVNVGAIVGGVVGGVGGALVIAAAVLLILRHVNRKREQERMEKEYQEAIKPVEFGDKSHTGNSSSSLNNGPSSSSFEDTTRVLSANNPFDDSRRISNGSILHDPTTVNPKILTVVNPDED